MTSASTTPPDQARLRVLVCDDDPDFRSLVSRALEPVCDVDQAGTAEQALQMQERSSYPLQLVDLDLPDITGLELCRRIREDDSMSVLIALTAHRRLFDIVDAREAGFDDLYFKPLSPQSLASIASSAMNRVRHWLDAS